MHSRSAASKAAQAAEKSASSQDDDSSKKKITFNIGSSRNGRKKAAPELVMTNSDTDYPNSGSSTKLGKVPSQVLGSSQDTTCTNETEPSNASLSLPSSGSSITYNAMKNSLTQECGSETEQLTFGSPEGTVGRVSRTSTPQKRKLQQKSDSDSRSTLQIIAKEVPVNHESNSDEIIESSQIGTVRILPEDGNLDGGASKRKRKDSDLSDSQLPNTLFTLPPKKCRQSVEIIGVHNKKSRPTPVVDLEDDESEDESNRLYLSQSQSQATHSMSHTESLLRLSQQITPIIVDVEEEAVSSKGNLLPSSLSCQNGNAFTNNSSLNMANTLPLTTNKSLYNFTPKDYHDDDEVACIDFPSSLQTFARVKGNLSSPSRKAMASPRMLARIGNASRLKSSAPSSAEVVNLDSDGQNTPESTNGTSTNAEDLTTTYHSVIVLVNYSLSVNPVTQSYRRELLDYCVQDAVACKAKLPPSLDDISPGALADVSGQSKTASVASVTSTGLFPLQPARQSIVSSISSASATSAASLQEKILLKSYAGPLRTAANMHNKFNSFDKSMGKDLKIDMCISDKQLTRLESMISFESPLASKSPPKRTGPTTNGELVLSCSPTELPSKQHRETLISPALDESIPTTEIASSGLLNGSDVHPDPPSPEQPPATKSKKKLRSVRKTAAKASAKQPVEEPSPETPKSSTKKRGSRARPNRKQAASVGKAKMSPIMETAPPPVKEVTPKEKKARVPPARKGLILSPKPVCVEKPSRRMATALAVEEVTSDDLLDPLITPEQPMLAFARWNDKRYYSCTVVGRTKDAKCNIKFDDGKSKCLAEEFVIPVGQLRKGLSVFAQVDGGDYEPGTIFELKVKDGIVMYVVELDSCKSVTIPRSALFLTEDQASVLQEETWGYSSPSCQARRPADVSLDNMVGGTRRRFASVIRRLPKVSGENRPPPTPTPYSDTSDDVNYATEDICGIDVEFYPLPYPSLKDGGLSKAAGKVKGRGKDVATEKTTDMQLNELLGPIPEHGCRLFAGMQFLFTSVSRPTDHNALGQMNESTCDSTSDGESVCRIPLFKERLVAQLEAGGGVVYDRFEQLEGYTDTYLIASAPCQTAKYLLCLAHRIPVISHDWVISAIKAMKKPPVTRYLLQAGRDIVNGYRVDQKPRASRDLILRNVDVLIVSEVDNFIGFWTKVLEAVGARVSSLAPDSDERPKETDIYVILSDNSILGSKMRTWADNFGVRIVNPEWVKYCLIKSAKGDINLEQFSIELY